MFIFMKYLLAQIFQYAYFYPVNLLQKNAVKIRNKLNYFKKLDYKKYMQLKYL